MGLRVLVLGILLLMLSGSFGGLRAQEGEAFTILQRLGGRGGVVDLAWSPDGERLAVSGFNGIWHYDAQLNDLGHWQPGADEDSLAPLGALSWSADGSQLAAARIGIAPSGQRFAGGVVYLLDAASGSVDATLEGDPEAVLRDIAWQPGGSLLAGVDGEQVWLWNSADGSRRNIPLPQNEVASLRWWEGLLLTVANTAEGSRVQAYDPITLQEAPYAAAELNGVIDPSASLVAFTDTGSGQVLVREVAEELAYREAQAAATEAAPAPEENAPENLAAFPVEVASPLSGGLRDFVWNADSSRLVGLMPRGNPPTVFVWNVPGNTLLHQFSYPEMSIPSRVSFTPDESALIVLLFPGILQRWNLQTGELEREVWADIGPISDVSWSPDGTMLATSSPPSPLTWLWSLEEAAPAGQLLDAATARFLGSIYSVAWHPDGARIAIGDQSNTDNLTPRVRILDAATNQELASLEVPGESPERNTGAFIRRLAWHADGERLLILRGDNQMGVESLLVWEPASGNLLLSAHFPGTVRAVWTGDAVLSASYNLSSGQSLLQLWDLASTSPTISHEFRFPLTDLAASPDGRRAVIVHPGLGGQGEALELLDLASGELLFTFPESFPDVLSLAWHPSEALLAVAQNAPTPQILLYSLEGESATLLQALAGHQPTLQPLMPLAWSPDGERLASVAGSEILVWGQP